MREMIRNIEDTQTEQALHGLLSLNVDNNAASSSVSPDGHNAVSQKLCHVIEKICLS